MATTLTLRSVKGSPLTNNEMDANLTSLANNKVESNGGDASLLINLNATQLTSGTVPPARLPAATTLVVGGVQLENTGTSNSTTLAATANSVLLANNAASANSVALAIALG